jgi:hypothetical protein
MFSMAERSLKKLGVYVVLIAVVVGALLHERRQAQIMAAERDGLRSQVEELNDRILNSASSSSREPDKETTPGQESAPTSTTISNKNAISEVNEGPVEKPVEEVKIPASAITDQMRISEAPPIAKDHPQNSSLAANFSQQPRYTQQQLELYRCSNQMYEINLAIAHWAMDHNGVIPEDLSELEGYISPMLLICPSVQPTSLAVSWKNFDRKDITYRLDPGARGALWDFPNPNRPSPVTKRCLYCPIHNIYTFNQVMAGGIPIDQLFRP